MSIITDLFSKLLPTDGSVVVFDTSAQTGLDTPRAQYNEGYVQNPYVRRACDLYGMRVSAIEPMFFDRADKEIDPMKTADPFVQMMMHPSPGRTHADLMNRIGRDLGIFGEAFIFPEKTPSGWILWSVDPMTVNVTVGSDQANPVVAWQTTNPVNGHALFYPNGAKDGRDELIHIKFTDPDAMKPRGMSPMRGCSKSIQMQNAIREWNISTTRNGAKPYVALKIPNQITPENREKLTAELNGKFGGSRNAGKGIVLDGGKEMEVLGMTAVEMDFANGMTACGKEIAIAYGIPPEKLGDSATKTYSNSVEASTEMVTNTIRPIIKMIYDAIWAFFKDKNIAKGIGKYTYDVEQLTDDMGVQVQLMTALQTTTYLTANEKRQKLGYERFDNDLADELMIGMADTPMSEFSSDVPLDNGDDLFRLMQDGLE